MIGRSAGPRRALCAAIATGARWERRRQNGAPMIGDPEPPCFHEEEGDAQVSKDCSCSRNLAIAAT